MLMACSYGKITGLNLLPDREIPVKAGPHKTSGPLGSSLMLLLRVIARTNLRVVVPQLLILSASETLAIQLLSPLINVPSVDNLSCA